MIFGVMLMLLLATMCIVQAQTFMMTQDYQDAQTAADTIADAVAIYAYNDSATYSEAVSYIDELVELIEENTGVVCSEVTLDEGDYEEGKASVTVSIGGTYSGNDGLTSYTANASASTEFDDNIITAGEGVDGAVAWAIQIANNDYYWYVYGAGGPRYYDCSHFVNAAFVNAGILPSGSYCNSAAVLSGGYVRYGFVDVTEYVDLSTGEGMVAGDILVSSSHVALYAGGGMIVEARNRAKGIVYGSYRSFARKVYRYVG